MIRSQMEAEAPHSSPAAGNIRCCCRVTQVETDMVTQAAKSSSVPQTMWLLLDPSNCLSTVHKPGSSEHTGKQMSTQGHFSIFRHQGDRAVWQDRHSFSVTTQLHGYYPAFLLCFIDFLLKQSFLPQLSTFHFLERSPSHVCFILPTKK